MAEGSSTKKDSSRRDQSDSEASKCSLVSPSKASELRKSGVIGGLRREVT